LPHISNQIAKYVLLSSNKRINLSLQKKQDFADDNDGQIPSIPDDDISENEYFHWQTDVFNNMDIDEVNKKNIHVSSYFSVQ
jgi:hypothetical protein